jgi:hypothetical protein
MVDGDVFTTMVLYDNSLFAESHYKAVKSLVDAEDELTHIVFLVNYTKNNVDKTKLDAEGKHGYENSEVHVQVRIETVIHRDLDDNNVITSNILSQIHSKARQFLRTH